MEDEVQTPPSAKPRVKKLSLIVAAALVAVLAVVGAWYLQVKVPHDEAVDAFKKANEGYNTAVERLDARNGELDAAVSGLQDVIDSDAQPLDANLLVSAGATIGEAQGSRNDAPAAPDLPRSTEDIKKATEEFPARIADIEDLGTTAR
ncbi:hypothetical protein [Nocardioides houyundeii]|uniref:hypothetical protein n=1 Tax=Nocardioides houyundeii TaxID=2045452 RepID=UPI000C78F559|nr:hypothetical protein [Nocardioides houyundeii]